MDYNTVLAMLLQVTKRNITQKELCQITGIDKGAMSARAARNSKFKPDEIKKIEKAFNVNLNNNFVNNNFIQIPVFGNVTASMGYGITVYNENQTGIYEISSQLAKDIGIVSGKTQMIFASGDSMYPTIEGGDSLLIDTSKKEVYAGRIYCVRIAGQLYAKRLQKIPPNTIKVISDNEKKYDAFYIDFSKSIDFDFEVIGEIRWWGRVAR